jgi:fumarate reductase flavoprotein subunit
MDFKTAAPPSFDIHVPVLIAGAGACGAVAALAATDAGADVLLLEQDLIPRGTTSMSQGLICAAGTQPQRRAGVQDDPDVFYADILAKTRGQTDTALARVIADRAGECVDWLIDRHDMPYELDIRFRAAYGHSRPRVHGWLGHSGDDLLQLLHARVQDNGAQVLLGARLVQIFADADGQVAGVQIERPDGALEQIGCGALVMAMGGFAGNRAMIGRHMPEAAAALYNGHEGSHGDAIVLGQGVGAAVADMGSYQGYAMLTDPQGISVPPGVVIEGGILVNARGERFVDETEDIAGMVHPVLAQPDGVAWVVFDAAIEGRCAYIPETAMLMKLNAAKSGDTLAELAKATGLEASALEASLGDAHDARVQGRPDRVGRDWAQDTPPVGPYRALKVRGAIYHTQGGLQIDPDARVQRPNGERLPNLYAGGGSARGVSGPSFWGYLPAMGLCAAVTLGMIAGGSAAAATAASTDGPPA